MNTEQTAPQGEVGDRPVFGRAIRDARRGKGLTQRELADKLGVDFTYISKMENDRYEIPPAEKTIRRIAEELDIEDIEQLLCGSGRMADVTYAEWYHLQAELRKAQARLVLADRLADASKDLRGQIHGHGPEKHVYEITCAFFCQALAAYEETRTDGKEGEGNE